MSACIMSRDSLGSDGRVVGDLLHNELRLAAQVDIRPGAVEQLSEDRVQRLLLRAHLLVAGLVSDGSGGPIKPTVYCPFSVAMNHLRTRSARSCGLAPSEMLAKSSGCSHQ